LSDLLTENLDGFDIVVNDCFAHNGANKKIQLIDHHGCPVDDKLVSMLENSFSLALTMRPNKLEVFALGNPFLSGLKI
jgi:hypothetical protein